MFKYPENKSPLTGNQQAFNMAAAHMLKQMAVSNNSEGCAYRGPRGLKCAVGALIPDSLYSEEYEGAAIHALVEKHKTLRTHFQNVSHELLQSLQRLHDCKPPCVWRKNLDRLAKKYNLEFHL